MKNISLEKAKAEYAAVEQNYLVALKNKGLKFAPVNSGRSKREELRAKLEERGVKVRNKGASLSHGFLSKACVECTGNNGSETFSTTFKCHRDCYFCFNRNLSDYQKFFDDGCPWEEELNRCASENASLACIGLTGGEPLLNLDDSIAFLHEAKKRFPDAHLRMYTSGDLLTEDAAKQLAKAGLDEIRFSVKDDDTALQQGKVLKAMRIARDYIPTLMVEMPVIPGAMDHMKDLMRKFDEVGIDGINMLEFCFPFCNWEEFDRRGFKLKNPPFDVMYDYGYSGGLAVDGSEELILELMLWAIDEGLGFGMHYCSLDNKHRSEIRQKNERANGLHPCLTFDEDDFFLKAGKAFGDDAAVAKSYLDSVGFSDYIEDTDEESITFPIVYLDALAEFEDGSEQELQLQVCSYVYEIDEQGGYIVDVNLEDYAR